MHFTIHTGGKQPATGKARQPSIGGLPEGAKAPELYRPFFGLRSPVGTFAISGKRFMTSGIGDEMDIIKRVYDFRSRAAIESPLFGFAMLPLSNLHTEVELRPDWRERSENRVRGRSGAATIGQRICRPRAKREGSRRQAVCGCFHPNLASGKTFASIARPAGHPKSESSIIAAHNLSLFCRLR